jgi:hypothetical protein
MVSFNPLSIAGGAMDASKIFAVEDIERAIGASAAVKAALIHKANEVKEYWVDYWNSIPHPYARVHTLKSGYVEHPGDYAKSINISYIRKMNGFTKARIKATDYKAHWIEYGCEHMPEFAPRAATLEHFGGGTTVSS